MADNIRNTKLDSSSSSSSSSSLYSCNNKVRGSLSSSWRNDRDDGDGGRMMMMMIWPPRCYTCSFCKREFRSAQALGGHMNVHRRDRAQLTQLTSSASALISLSSTPAPAPTNYSSYHNNATTTTTTSSINLNYPPKPDPNNHHLHMLLSPPTVQSSSHSHINHFGCRFMMSNPLNSYSSPSSCRGTPTSPQQCSCDSFNNTSGFISLDLEMNNIHPHPPANHNLDLELRLGCN